MSLPWDEDEYAYYPVPDAYAIPLPVDARQTDIRAMMDWANRKGMKEIITTREGATFTELNGLWLIALYGGQPIHHDRHMSEAGISANQDTWILVCSSTETQMLISEVVPEIFKHIPLRTGTLIYLNTTNRHLVSRIVGDEKSIMLQIQGFDDSQSEAALDEMLNRWRKICHERIDTPKAEQ